MTRERRARKACMGKDVGKAPCLAANLKSDDMIVENVADGVVTMSLDRRCSRPPQKDAHQVCWTRISPMGIDDRDPPGDAASGNNPHRWAAAVPWHTPHHVTMEFTIGHYCPTPKPTCVCVTVASGTPASKKQCRRLPTARIVVSCNGAGFTRSRWHNSQNTRMPVPRIHTTTPTADLSP
jgi:hypothetical protein